jgi:U1 small nuclear ribonucleoprotein
MLIRMLQSKLVRLQCIQHVNHTALCIYSNAYHTLFVGRLSYDTTDNKLRREFEEYGVIKTCKIVTDLEGKSRGYAFIEFEKEEGMTAAYKRGDGKKIDGRRVQIDVERGRTVRDWRPRRLGGGLGAYICRHEMTKHVRE